jgi:hypothetical protein
VGNIQRAVDFLCEEGIWVLFEVFSLRLLYFWEGRLGRSKAITSVFMAENELINSHAPGPGKVEREMVLKCCRKGASLAGLRQWVESLVCLGLWGEALYHGGKMLLRAVPFSHPLHG